MTTSGNALRLEDIWTVLNPVLSTTTLDLVQVDWNTSGSRSIGIVTTSELNGTIYEEKKLKCMAIIIKYTLRVLQNSIYLYG